MHTFRIYDVQNKKYVEALLNPNGNVGAFSTEESKHRFIVEFAAGINDRNSKPIYEGDLLTFIHEFEGREPSSQKTHKVSEPYLVYYSKESCCFLMQRGQGIWKDVRHLPMPYDLHHTTVIGNIHEHPALFYGAPGTYYGGS